MQDYLRSEQCGGLVPVDEQKTKFVVNSFAHLQPEVIYTHSLISGEAFAGVLEETRRLQQSRLDEFARALTDYAQRDEPDQVRAQGVKYIGLTCMFCHSKQWVTCNSNYRIGNPFKINRLYHNAANSFISLSEWCIVYMAAGLRAPGEFAHTADQGQEDFRA